MPEASKKSAFKTNRTYKTDMKLVIIHKWQESIPEASILTLFSGKSDKVYGFDATA